MTEADFEKLKASSNPQEKSKRSISRSKGKKELTETEKKIAAIPKGTLDEDRILYWIWGKVNPTYMKYVSKYILLDYLEVHPDILKAFGFHQKEYHRVVLSMITERHDMMTFDEFDVSLFNKGSHD